MSADADSQDIGQLFAIVVLKPTEIIATTQPKVLRVTSPTSTSKSRESARLSRLCKNKNRKPTENRKRVYTFYINKAGGQVHVSMQHERALPAA